MDTRNLKNTDAIIANLNQNSRSITAEFYSFIVDNSFLTDKEKKREYQKLRTRIGKNNDNISNYIILDILNQSNLKDTKEALQKWLKVAQKCIKDRNYHSLFAIQAALNHAAIARLHKHLPKKSTKVLDQLDTLLNPRPNFKALRTTLANEKDSKYIPYLGLITQDLGSAAENETESNEEVLKLHANIIGKLAPVIATNNQKLENNKTKPVHEFSEEKLNQVVTNQIEQARQETELQDLDDVFDQKSREVEVAKKSAKEKEGKVRASSFSTTTSTTTMETTPDLPSEPKPAKEAKPGLLKRTFSRKFIDKDKQADPKLNRTQSQSKLTKYTFFNDPTFAQSTQITRGRSKTDVDKDRDKRGSISSKEESDNEMGESSSSTNSSPRGSVKR